MSARPARHLLWQAVRLAIGVVVLAYAVGVLAFFALQALLPACSPQLSPLAYLGPFLFAPLLATLPLALLARLWVAAAANLAVLILAAVLYGPFFLAPPGDSSATAGELLRVMTFNLHASQAPAEELAAVIAAEDADIVAVQELDGVSAAAFRAGLGDRYPHLLLDPEAGGNGLLSRFPILAADVFQPASVGRQALQATLDVRGTAVHVIVAHPNPPAPCWIPGWPLPTGLCCGQLEAQIAAIAQRAESVAGPVLVLGDLNVSDRTRAYALMAAELSDAFREAGSGFGFTFPNRRPIGPVFVTRPLVRIDHIFHSGHLLPRQSRVVCPSVSDHCYVVAQFGPVALGRGAVHPGGGFSLLP